MSPFVDGSALWIWNNTQAASSTAPGTIPFVKTFYVAANFPCVTGSKFMAELHVCVDDFAAVYLNERGILKGQGWFGNCTTISFSLNIGSNTIRIFATNNGVNDSSAGVLFSAYCQNKIMFHSDSSWCTASDSSCSSGTQGDTQQSYILAVCTFLSGSKQNKKTN
jgi:hypothetical protein